jgi:hypothetical protein
MISCLSYVGVVSEFRLYQIVELVGGPCNDLCNELCTFWSLRRLLTMDLFVRHSSRLCVPSLGHDLISFILVTRAKKREKAQLNFGLLMALI